MKLPHICSVTFEVDVHLNGGDQCTVKPERVTVKSGDRVHIMQPVRLDVEHDLGRLVSYKIISDEEE